MTRNTISLKVFSDSPEKLKKVQRIESFRRDKSMTVPEIIEWLADSYLEKADKEAQKTENNNTLNVIL